MRRIAFVIEYLNSGGAERAALNMAEFAFRSECVVVAERRGGDLSSDPAASRVIYASGSSQRSDRPRRIMRLVRTLRALRPDVVVSVLSPVVTAAASQLLGVPMIHWLQAPWSTTGAVSDTRGGAVRTQVLRVALARASVIAAASPGLRDESIALGIDVNKLAVLPNGLRLPPDVEDSPRKAEAVSTIVTIGRLEKPKRHDLTLRAVARIAIDQAVRLVVVGSGESENQLRELAKQLGLAGAVEFTGFVPSPYPHLRQADVFTLATDHEGFGNVIVEALACGLRVVVSDVPYGPRFILDDGEYGTLVQPDSVEALEAGLREALVRAPLDGAAANVRARAAAFEVERVAGRFEALVDLAEHGGRRVPPEFRSWS